MPTPSTSRLPPLPQDEDEFENIVRDALCLRYSDPSFKRYGRGGQKQHGIDGLADNSGPNAGVAWQATLQHVGALGKLKTDLEKLDRSLLPVRHLLFCVGLTRDARLQDEVARLSHARVDSNKCSLEVLFWDDLYLDLCVDRRVLEKHFSWFVGTEAIYEHGLVMLGLDLIFDAEFTAMAGDRWTMRFRGPLRSGMPEVALYIADFDALPPEERFVASEHIGQARQLAAAPTLEGHRLSLSLNPAPPRSRLSSHGSTFALDTAGELGRSRRGIQRIRGAEAAIQSINTAMGMVYGESSHAPTAGSRCLKFFHSETDKTMVSRLIALELTRLAYVPIASAKAPPLDFIRAVTALRIASREPDDHGRIQAQAELLLEGHGPWSGELSIFVGRNPAKTDGMPTDGAGDLSEGFDQPARNPEGAGGPRETVELVNLDEIRQMVLFTEDLETALAEWDDKRDDLEFGVFEGGGSETLREASKNASDFLKWVGRENNALRNFIKTFDSLINRAFRQTFDTDGTVLSARRRAYFIQRWSGLYKELLDWGLQWEIPGASQEFHCLFDMQRRTALSFADEVRDAPRRLREQLQDAIDHPGRDVHVSLTLDCEDGHADELDLEIRRAMVAIEPNLAGLMDDA